MVIYMIRSSHFYRAVSHMTLVYFSEQVLHLRHNPQPQPQPGILDLGARIPDSGRIRVAPKIGQIMCCGNIRPYKEVQINPEWIQNMVQAFVFVGK